MLTDKTAVRARPVPIALPRRSRVIACAVVAGAASLLHADPIPVQLVIDGGSAHLVRDGATFDVKGAGGDASLALLAGTGGNTARTWGVDSGTTAFLDQAHANGLAVSVGIWLGHTEQGFNYNNPSQVAAQLESARQAVLALRDHPAVLVWGIGNEMEGYGAGDDDAIWNAVEDIAAMVKSLDPNHPTMTTVAEIGGSRVAKIHALCPDIDIVGINTYGGVGSIPTRYRDAGGTKPYMVTEYAIWATYETGTTSWGAPWEPTSTVKGPVYANAYNTLHADSLCLGSIAFAWGDKREGTMTWNGMLLEDGSKLEVIDDLQAAWGGPALTNHCPRINSFSASGSNSLEQGDTLAVSLSATDPDGDALTYEYRLWEELGSGNPGDTQPTPPEYPASILSSGPTGVTITTPPSEGAYRLFVFVRDAHGSAATANVPLYVTGDAPHAAVDLPVWVYGEGVPESPWEPTGYMGSVGAISMDFDDTTNPHAGSTALRVQYNDTGNWGGVVWQNPANNWGSVDGGVDLHGASSLHFWARGAQGGEQMTIGSGLYDSGVAYPDSSKNEIGVTLTNQWAEYVIPLAGRDMTSIARGFYWILGGQGHPLTFYFDDIRYVGCAPADLDGNGVLNLDDVNAFAAAFVSGDPLADVDGNGSLNLDDINVFASAFVAGCP